MSHVKSLEAERKSAAALVDSKRTTDALTAAQLVSFSDKLFAIALARPDVWRAMKERELRLSRDEEYGELKDRRADAIANAQRSVGGGSGGGVGGGGAVGFGGGPFGRSVGGTLSAMGTAAPAPVVSVPGMSGAGVAGGGIAVRRNDPARVRAAVGHAHVMHRLNVSADAKPKAF
jgi:hypothetical protein